MKNLSVLLALVASLFLSSCADTLVGKAQQTAGTAARGFDTFTTFESEHQAELLAVSPAIHKQAQVLRHKPCATCDPNGIAWVKTLWQYTETYRLNPSDGSAKQNVVTAMALVTQTLTTINQYFLTAAARGIQAPAQLPVVK